MCRFNSLVLLPPALFLQKTFKHLAAAVLSSSLIDVSITLKKFPLSNRQTGHQRKGSSIELLSICAR